MGIRKIISKTLAVAVLGATALTVSGPISNADAKGITIDQPKIVYGYADITSTKITNFDEIMALYKKGYFGAEKHAKFDAKKLVNRAEMADAVWRTHGKPYITAPKKSPIADVSTKDKYYKQIVWAVDNGLLTKNSKNKYRPNGLMTRKTMSTVMYRSEGSPNYFAWYKSPWKDMDTSATSYKATSWARENKIILPNRYKEIRPDNKISRSSFAAYMARYDKISKVRKGARIVKVSFAAPNKFANGLESYKVEYNNAFFSTPIGHKFDDASTPDFILYKEFYDKRDGRFSPAVFTKSETYRDASASSNTVRNAVCTVTKDTDVVLVVKCK